jgi:hypothetical protein
MMSRACCGHSRTMYAEHELVAGRMALCGKATHGSFYARLFPDLKGERVEPVSAPLWGRFRILFERPCCCANSDTLIDRPNAPR